MIKYYCDRCGKEMDPLFRFKVTVDLPEIRAVGDASYAGDYSFCSDCMAKIHKELIKGIEE